MPNIIRNNKLIEVPDNFSLAEAINRWSDITAPFAVAVNHTFVPSQQFADIKLQEGDVVDIVVPMQGG